MRYWPTVGEIIVSLDIYLKNGAALKNSSSERFKAKQITVILGMSDLPNFRNLKKSFDKFREDADKNFDRT